jgi:hypothetical protein
MTSESSQIVQLIAAVMELLQRNAAPIAATQPQPPALVYRPEDPLRTFAGEPQGDPEAFIAEVESYFRQVGEHNLTPQHCVLVAHRQLRGDAAKRNRYFKDEDTSVEELCVRLRRDYGTENQFTRLLTAFTGATLCQNDPQHPRGIAEFIETATNVISWAGAEEKKKKASENWHRTAVTSPTQPDASSYGHLQRQY